MYYDFSLTYEGLNNCFILYKLIEIIYIYIYIHHNAVFVHNIMSK